MKPFNDHVESLLQQLPLRILKGDEPVVKERLRRALLALARDQRHVCAEAVRDLSSDRAHQAVMNARLP